MSDAQDREDFAKWYEEAGLKKYENDLKLMMSGKFTAVVEEKFKTWQAEHHAKAAAAAFQEENKQLRRMLAIRIAGATLYADDGELQDSSVHPAIDFKRDTPREIESKLATRVKDTVTRAHALGNDHTRIIVDALKDSDRLYVDPATGNVTVGLSPLLAWHRGYVIQYFQLEGSDSDWTDYTAKEPPEETKRLAWRIKPGQLLQKARAMPHAVVDEAQFDGLPDLPSPAGYVQRSHKDEILVADGGKIIGTPFFIDEDTPGDSIFTNKQVEQIQREAFLAGRVKVTRPMYSSQAGAWSKFTNAEILTLAPIMMPLGWSKDEEDGFCAGFRRCASMIASSESAPIVALDSQAQVFLEHCLKSEEVATDAPTRLARTKELMNWFERFADGNANAKWLRGHAFELAYLIATSRDTRAQNV